MESWVAYIFGHSAILRRLNAELVETHGLSLNEYEVMLRLWHSPDRQMRRIDLAESVLISASGITRLLDRLEASGDVTKAHCSSDARVTYAVLTDCGAARFEQARRTHLEGVQRAFGDHFDESELATLSTLLNRIRLAESHPADDGGQSCG